MSGHIVHVLRVFRGTVVFNVVHPDGPAFDLTAETDSQFELLVFRCVPDTVHL